MSAKGIILVYMLELTTTYNNQEGSTIMSAKTNNTNIYAWNNHYLK